MFRKPLLVLRDPELIKKITVKDFDHFLNRNLIIDAETEPLFGKSLIMLEGEEMKVDKIEENEGYRYIVYW